MLISAKVSLHRYFRHLYKYSEKVATLNLTFTSALQGLPGPPGEKGETGDVGPLVSLYIYKYMISVITAGVNPFISIKS